MNQKFIKFQERVHGKEATQKWLEDIPRIINEVKVKWDLKIGEEFELSYNYVISTTCKNGEKAVLKIYFPGDPEYLNQLTTLKIFSGEGSVKLLEADHKNSTILLEQCVPGKFLSILNNENQETLIFIDVVKKLWKKPAGNHKFQNISKELKDFDWYFKNLDKIKHPLPKDLVIKAQKTFKRLTGSQKDLYLLHGDLHHENILSSKRGWLAIDPKGILGEREYEVTAFMRNPIKRAKQNLLTLEILQRRAEIISDNLSLDKERLIGWAFAQTLLSVIWSMQINSNREKYWYKIAEELEKLL